MIKRKFLDQGTLDVDMKELGESKNAGRSQQGSNTTLH